jgi:hypothetical protein
MEGKTIILPIKKYSNKISGYCLIGTYLTVRNTYEKGFNPSKEEKLLYKRFKNKVTTLELIKLFKKHQYFIKIFSEKDYRSLMGNATNTSDLVKSYVNFVDKSKIFEKTGVIPNPKLLISCLGEKYLLLVNGIKEERPHMRIIFGYKDGNFLIADPSCQKDLEVSCNLLKSLLAAPSGFWMVAVRPEREKNVRERKNIGANVKKN